MENMLSEFSDTTFGIEVKHVAHQRLSCFKTTFSGKNLTKNAVLL